MSTTPRPRRRRPTTEAVGSLEVNDGTLRETIGISPERTSLAPDPQHFITPPMVPTNERVVHFQREGHPRTID